ncbi:NAD(P)/FAD-dependent oxidoreductase [Terasakiispira papahanaumokuakeensis]|uniref:NAD(P)/FAD-dependent oxidoreductase n=1 Tax=Terasakiispira papahanaumokuakeensis TaxID=197479 RepID=UPI000A010500|nr:FAD-dependent oxidoreductase [Terasakiispira papahanaumokuakeensis]
MASETSAVSPQRDADIVVVGAGIIGVAAALQLQRQGWQVAVVDRQPPGLGASFGNAGHMATEQVFPIADTSILMRLPKMLLDPMGPLRLDWRHFPKAIPWFSKLLWNLRAEPYQRSVKGIRALNESSLSAWRALLSSVGQASLMHDDGSLLIYERAASFEALKAVEAKMKAQEVPVQFWQGDAVRALAPQLSSSIQGGLFFPATSHVVNPYLIVTALVSAAREAGVHFIQDEVLHGQVVAEGVRLSTTTGQLFCHRVLVACGAHSAPLTRELTGVKVPLDTERGYHLMLPQESGRLPVAVTSLERRFIMTPMDEGLRLAGTVEFAGLKRPANMPRAWQLQRLSQGLFQRPLNVEGATPWMGFRPSLPDSLPVIDAVQDGKVLLAFGHHHLGLTQAALTAELVAQFCGVRLPTGNGFAPADMGPAPQNIDLSLYRLGRFA